MTADLLLTQISDIKFHAVSLLSARAGTLTVNEKIAIQAIYDMIDSWLLNKIENKRYTLEEYVDTFIVEHNMILKASKNLEVQRFSKILERGITW
jgi:hypothetical protein